MRLRKAIKGKIFDVLEWILCKWDQPRIKKMSVDFPETVVRLEKYVPHDNEFHLVESSVMFWICRKKETPDQLFGSLALFVDQKQQPKEYWTGREFKEYKDLTEDEKSKLAVYYDFSEAAGTATPNPITEEMPSWDNPAK